MMLSSLGGGIFINSFELAYRDEANGLRLTLAGQTSGMTRNDIAGYVCDDVTGRINAISGTG